MPPRTAPGKGRGRGVQGSSAQPPGGPGPRGGAPVQGRGAGSSAIVEGIPGLPSIGARVRTVAVKRPGYGCAGRPIEVVTNSFAVDIPDVIIRQYKAITPSWLSSKFKMDLVERLQNDVAPEIFSSKAAYDGGNNMYASHELSLGPDFSREFYVTLPSSGSGGHPLELYGITVTKVTQISSEVLHQFVTGQRWENNKPLKRILMALNVVIRMNPRRNYMYNSRYFFTNHETRPIGGGIVLWRAYFQSIRPSIDRLLINVDISTRMVCKPGSLIDLCLDFFGQPSSSPTMLAGGRIPDLERLRLQKFLSGMRITTTHTNRNRGPTQRVVKRLSTHGSNQMFFEMNGHGRMSVAQYFQQHANSPLQFPQLLCVEVETGALLPMELCNAPQGQTMRMRQQIHSQMNRVTEFSRMSPTDRFHKIEAGLEVFDYGQSEYIRDFGLDVQVAEGLLSVNARVLEAPRLRYSENSTRPTIKPCDGAWNMLDKRLRKPMLIKAWTVVIYEGQRHFPRSAGDDLVRDLISACKTVGMEVLEQDPIIIYQNPQGNIAKQLLSVGRRCCEKNRISPNLIVVVLPGEAGSDIYTAVSKNFGDTKMGVATQCLKSNKCRNAKPYYWANVCLKINVKLGGINLIPDPSSVALLVGANIRHPGPGADFRPTFTSLVGTVDGNCVKYVATTKVQEERVELITGLKDMCKHILNLHIDYRKAVEKAGPPTRLIFYRNGVSAGQYQRVLNEAACSELELKVKITLIIVNKTGHIRFKCKNDDDADKSGNCPAGTIVDRDIGNPSKFDFYLQSHGGVNGISSPTHYTVLFDDNEFDADAIQSISFMLCHVYSRATRSVSIPAPAYYANIVCARANTHYDPESNRRISERATQTDANASRIVKTFMNSFMPLHKNQEKFMYFS